MGSEKLESEGLGWGDWSWGWGVDVRGVGVEGFRVRGVGFWSLGLESGVGVGELRLGSGGVKTQTTVNKSYAQIWQNFWLP